MLLTLRYVCILAVITPVPSCTAPEENSAAARVEVTAAPQRGIPVAVAPATIAPVAAAPLAGDWAMTDAGIGRLRAGMSVADVRAILPRFNVPRGADGAGCYYVAIEGLPPGVSVMVNENRIGRVDVRSGGLATPAGARIGDSEERIVTL